MVLPYVAQTVAGKTGAAAILLVIFMSTTSIASAQMIATGSIISFNIYGTYINPHPTNAQLLKWSHLGVVFTSLFISTLATAFHKRGVDMTWLLYMIGLITCPGVFPTCLALLWRKQSREAAITAPIVGMACGLAVWFGNAYAYYGEITIQSTGGTMPCLFRTVTSFVVPLPVTVGISLLQNREFDWTVLGEIQMVKVESEPNSTASESGTETETTEQTGNNVALFSTPEITKYLRRMSRWAAFWAAFTIIGHVLLWPVPMFGARMVFSKSVSAVISLIWLWCTLVVAIFYPLVDGGLQQMWAVITRKGAIRKREVKNGGGENPSPDESAVEVGVVTKA